MHLKLQVSAQVPLDVSCGLHISIRQLRLVGSISNMELSHCGCGCNCGCCGWIFVSIAAAAAASLWPSSYCHLALPLEAHVYDRVDNDQLPLNTFYWRHQIACSLEIRKCSNFPKCA